MANEPRSRRSPRSLGREWAFLFLYQQDAAGFSDDVEEQLQLFWSQIRGETRPLSEAKIGGIPDAKGLAEGAPFAETLIRQSLQARDEIDAAISAASENWTLGRMSAIDRNILRVGATELRLASTPVPVIIDEAIDLAKTFGESDSYKFINGILDRLSKDRKDA
ncbi:MAG: hypothetical protein RL095_2593 [Verrucomicrobiota bacterium]|jgi:N utilization substance protein B